MRIRVVVMGLLVSLAAACGAEDEKCTPMCAELVCGDDGCGGVCGTCRDGSVCAAGQCVECAPQCVGKQCGPDGCGSSCGACSDGQVCEAFSYFCVDKPANCKSVCDQNEFECGPDGCGGECGECGDGFCNPETHLCLTGCLPNCAGKECGDDGCGASCGDCTDGDTCNAAGQCEAGDVLPEDAFTILYGDRGRIPGYNDQEDDLFVVKPDKTNPIDPTDPNPAALTTFALNGAQDCQLILEEDAEGNATKTGPCSCQFGCVVDRGLKFVAVSLKKPTASGFTFQLGRFNTSLKVAMVKGIILENVVDIKFAGNYMYYSSQAICQGLSCQYIISRVQLDPIGQPEELFAFPPEDDPDWPSQSTYKGHFKASMDGSTLVMLGTTIRSLRVYMWQAGVLSELDYICNQMVGGSCIGAGSEYSDLDPVAISRDNSKIAAFTIAEADFKVRVYDTSTKTQKYQTLFSVPTGTYLANICGALNNDPWRFKTVVGEPLFSLDGQYLYFIGSNDCGVLQGQGKPLTNIYKMPVGVVGDGTAFEESDLTNITQNPKGDLTKNLWIDGFDLSPSGKTIVFTASPMYGNGELLADSSERARKDREVWVMGANGAGKTQVTDVLKYMARTPIALDNTALGVYNK